MNTMEEYAPLADNIELPQRLSPRVLLQDMRAFAFNNPSFKNGMSDELFIEVAEGESQINDDKFDDYIRVGYKFEASRYHHLHDNATRAELRFQLSIIATRSYVALPAHIATDAYGIDDPEKAVENGGYGSREHRIDFMVSTFQRVLNVCENYRYLDEHGDTVAFTCTCEQGLTTSEEPHADEELITEDDEDDEDDDETQEIDDSPAPRPVHEAIEFQNPVEAAELWNQLAAMEQNFTDEDLGIQEDQYLRQAYAAFTLLKRGLQRQLGL
jgi:hypothetical protein